MIASTPARFRWLERGAGEPVVMLHGLMGEMDHWESTLEALGPFRRPIALELPIFDPVLTDVSVPALADYVRRFMEAIELPPAIVCGNSLGGHVALAPQRIGDLDALDAHGDVGQRPGRHQGQDESPDPDAAARSCDRVDGAGLRPAESVAGR